MLRHRHSTIKREWSARRLVGLLLNAEEPTSPTLSPLRAPHRSRAASIVRQWRIILVVLLVLIALVPGIKGVRKVHRHFKCRYPPAADDAEGFVTPYYPPPEYPSGFDTIARPQKACVKEVALPQVALLFLCKGNVPHEAMWRAWFEHAAGKLPEEYIQPRVCGPVGGKTAGSVFAACMEGQKEEIEEEPGPRSSKGMDIDGDSISSSSNTARQLLDDDTTDSSTTITDRSIDDVISRQFLFDVWLHPIKNFTGYHDHSIFHGYELPRSHRAVTVWGTHSLIDGTRAMLAAALTNPNAKKFVLLSESDVPLYSPMVLYKQMMDERVSRLNACNLTGWETDQWQRWRPDMGAVGLEPYMWRKSWQWFALTREHAELVVKDTAMDSVFRSTCREKWDEGWCNHRVCYSDEHYIPTLLASYGMDNATDCTGELTDRDWSRVKVGTPHPYEYSPGEINATLIHLLRHPERPGCESPEMATATAAAGFVDVKAAVLGSRRKQKLLRNRDTAAVLKELCARPLVRYQPVGPRCPLLARKFLNDSASTVLDTLASCQGGLRILKSDECEGGEQSGIDPDELKASLERAEEERQRERRRKKAWHRKKGWRWVIGLASLLGVIAVVMYIQRRKPQFWVGCWGSSSRTSTGLE